MKINFAQELKNLEGGVLLKDEKNKDPWTLDFVAVYALLNSEDKVDGAEKYERYKLAQKVKEVNEDFTVEEIAKIKKLIGETFSAIIVGPAWDILEKVN